MRCATASRPTCSSAAPIFRIIQALLGSRQIGHDGALHPRRHRHDRGHREPARPAVAASQEAQEEQERPAAGVTAGGHVPSSAGGRGYLPRPRSGVASCQCRSRQPRPAEGDVGHRALPHGGARRPCRALRRLPAHGHRLQQLPQPALPEVSGRRRQGMARRARGRSAAGAVLPCGVHAAGRHCGHRLSEQGRDLRHPVHGLGRDHDSPSRPIPSTSAPASASPRCFTPGARR